METDLSKVAVVGSAEEAREMGLDPAREPTCGPERQGVKGCPLYAKCNRPEKNLTGHVRWLDKDGNLVAPATEGSTREGPGPMNVGWQRYRRYSRRKTQLLNGTCTCWEFPHLKRNHESRNIGEDEMRAGMKIIAIEGQEIYLPGTKEKQEGLRVIHETQKGGMRFIIPAFVRPADNSAFAANAFAIAEAERAAMRAEAIDLKDFAKLKPEGAVGADAATDPGAARRGAASRG